MSTVAPLVSQETLQGNPRYGAGWHVSLCGCGLTANITRPAPESPHVSLGFMLLCSALDMLSPVFLMGPCGCSVCSKPLRIQKTWDPLHDSVLTAGCVPGHPDLGTTKIRSWVHGWQWGLGAKESQRELESITGITRCGSMVRGARADKLWR